jgi:mono/diheme cytochrome c family protein
MRPAGDEELRRLRAAAQLLHRPRRRSAADLVRHLTGVQAQVLSAAGLALRARTGGLTRAKVDRARLHDRSIVLTWAMRGTLHLVAAEDHAWLVPLTTEPRVANALRRLAQEGVPADGAERGVRAIARMLDAHGPLTRAEVASRLRRHRVRTEGQAIAHLLWLAVAHGAACHGPDGAFVSPGDWLPRSGPVDRDDALRELAVRYLRSHGPAAPEDLAFWSGLRLTDARRAWGTVQAGLEEIRTERGGRMWSLKRRGERAPLGLVRLLPSFDEYLLGWRDRSFMATPTHWREINRGGGWLHPVLLCDGIAAGRWSLEPEGRGRRAEVRPFGRLTSSVRRGVDAEARDIGRYLGEEVGLDVAS